MRTDRELISFVMDEWLEVNEYQEDDKVRFEYRGIVLSGLCEFISVLFQKGRLCILELGRVHSILKTKAIEYGVYDLGYWFVTSDIDYNKAYNHRLNFLNRIIDDYEKEAGKESDCSCKENQWCKSCYHDKKRFIL